MIEALPYQRPTKRRLKGFALGEQLIEDILVLGLLAPIDINLRAPILGGTKAGQSNPSPFYANPSPKFFLFKNS